MLSAGQQVVDSIKLRTVAHVLMYLIYLCSYTGVKKRKQVFNYSLKTTKNGTNTGNYLTYAEKRFQKKRV